jgi:predicted transcriptional regulator
MKDQVQELPALLRRLRKQHQKSVVRTQALLKEQKQTQQQICRLMRDQPRTVPDLAQATGLPGHEVLWHITALRKYGQVVETGQAGAYYLYQTTKEASQ